MLDQFRNSRLRNSPVPKSDGYRFGLGYCLNGYCLNGYCLNGCFGVHYYNFVGSELTETSVFTNLEIELSLKCSEACTTSLLEAKSGNKLPVFEVLTETSRINFRLSPGKKSHQVVVH